MESGTPVFGDNTNHPIKEFNENGAARSDGLSTRFTGIIRTRTFGVNGDTLWYRYKGKADVFLAVNSHRQIAGPLHGIVRQKLDSKGDEWKWARPSCARLHRPSRACGVQSQRRVCA